MSPALCSLRGVAASKALSSVAPHSSEELNGIDDAQAAPQPFVSCLHRLVTRCEIAPGSFGSHATNRCWIVFAAAK